MTVRERLPAIGWTFGALIMGTLIAFFFVFRTLFTDGPQALDHPEYLVAHALNFVVYFAVTVLAVRYGPPPSGVWLGPLLLPAAVILLNYSEPTLLLRVWTLLMVATGSAAGGFLGMAWRRRSDAQTPDGGAAEPRA